MSDNEVTLTIPDMRAGALWRRTVRYAIAAARVLGADVHVAEQRSLLDSRFTIRATGTEQAIEPLMKLTKLAAQHTNRPSR